MNRTLRERMIVVLVLATVGMGAVVWYPVRNGFTRWGMVALLAAGAISLLVLLWRRKAWRIGLLVIAGLVIAVGVMPGRQHDPVALRGAYVRALKNYVGTKYVWAGENGRGVDCSGLVRTAMMDALMREAARTANPALLREALWLWWHDASAREMDEGYKGRTILFGQLGIDQITPERLAPGELAIVSYGEHVLVYLGDYQWIEADPTDLRVEILDANSPSHWLKMNARFFRWQCLEKSTEP